MRIVVDPQGWVRAQDHCWRAALGRGGVGRKAQEGDGVTPSGQWRLGRVFWREDRLAMPQTALACAPIHADMGWCDDVEHGDYNQLITLPHPAHHEQLWREDRLYDVVVEILFNTNPVEPGRGSAIFLHVAKADYAPTEGCIALKLEDLIELLRLANEKALLCVPG